VQVWDVAVGRRIVKMKGHSGRVGAVAWNRDLVSSGSRAGSIVQRDIRVPSPAVERELVGHTKEVSRRLFVE
jgi:cell division cycle 20-like protein 1 (cofactor of APC complex)